MFNELGNRRGEMWNLRIKDVQFEQIGNATTAILTLSGKSGTRKRRVYDSVADLRDWINNHPMHDDPLAPLFLTSFGKPFASPFGIYQVIRKLGVKILKKKIRPHMFTHTAATRDVRYFTDREAMKLFGWSKPEMVGVYGHLSMKDVDDKDLVLHGLKNKQEILQPIMQIQKCVKCGEENAPIALYCGRCGDVLGPEDQLTKQNAELAERIKKLEGQFETIQPQYDRTDWFTKPLERPKIG